MLRVRYTAWDGTQEIRLEAERVFEKLAEHLSFTDDVQQALDWLLHQGLEWEEGVRVMGLDDFLEQLREAMRSRYREVNLRDAFRELREKLEELLDLERDALDRLADREAAARKRELLDRLSPRLSEALEQLRDHAFADDDARRALEDLLEELEDIHDLEDFQRRYGDLFQGPQSLSYREAVELMREMERWKRLEEALLSGNLEAVDLESLGALLGPEAARNFQLLKEVMVLLVNAGYVTQREGRAHLSPKGVRKIGQLALRDIYQGLLRVTRRPGTPLDVHPEDFEVHAAAHTTTTSTVLLLDMSWSMSWEGRFAAAKKVAMAMESLIRARYPRDYFAIVGFFTRAVELRLRDLPEASWNMGDPFTNLQDGLRKAADLLARHPSNNQHIIIITDGQPTAYFLRGRLYCEWPLSFGGISMRAAQETLKEVERVTRRGIVINTFMLDDSPSLRAFVERMTRINKGRALYTRPDRLGEYLLVDYMAKKRKRV